MVSNTRIWIFQFLSDAKKQTQEMLISFFVLYKEWHAPVETTTPSFRQHTSPGAKKSTKHLQLVINFIWKEVVFMSISPYHTTGSQMGFCTAERVNKLLFFSVQTELKRFLEMSIQHGNKLLFSNKKNLFHKKKGAFSCDLRHLQMEELPLGWRWCGSIWNTRHD